MLPTGSLRPDLREVFDWLSGHRPLPPPSAACAPSKSYHCCCAVDAITHTLSYDHSGHNHVCEQGTPAGAPEARGLCVRNQLPTRASPAMVVGRVFMPNNAGIQFRPCDLV